MADLICSLKKSGGPDNANSLRIFLGYYRFIIRMSLEGKSLGPISFDKNIVKVGKKKGEFNRRGRELFCFFIGITFP